MAVAAVILSGCGYAGEPKAPALRRPDKVTDLGAVERGKKIVITFTLPLETTEGLPIQGDQDVELRVGVIPNPWNQSEWENKSERVPVPGHQPAPVTMVGRKIAPTTDRTAFYRAVEIDAAKYTGKTIVMGVRVHGPKGRDDGWSNIVQLDVQPVLPVPVNLKAADARDAVHLEWSADAPSFRIYRKKPADADWTLAGESTQASFDDKSIDYGKPLQYFVRSLRKVGDNWLESDDSASITWTPKDVFPPAVPSGLIVISGTKTIELVWDRVSDSDLAGYRVYRNGQKIADALVTPAYSDKDVVTGTKYSYRISAVDQAGNESQQCAAMDAVLE
jgi:hypothetical protein